MNTDYNLYKIFLYLFEERSISKTANKLYVSQPAISYSLKELETQLGYTLFYRNSKGIEPTMEAKELYSYISTAFNILKDAEEHIKNLNDLNTGCIRIGVPSYLGSFYFNDTITEFRKEYPGIQFEIVSDTNEAMLEMLETRKLDFVISTLPIESKKNITKVTLEKLANCFAYYKGSFSSIHKVEELHNYPIILPGKNSSMRLKLDEYLESKNIMIQPVLESWSVDSLLNATRSKMGIGYFIKEVLEKQVDSSEFEIVPLNELPSVDICCVYMEEFLTAASKKFIEKLKNRNVH
jgi:DNA-binding transcriptional LysR family regulator